MSNIFRVDITRLLKTTMRLRPDRILVGKVRKSRGSRAFAAAFTASVLGAGLYVAAPTPAYAIYCSNCSTFYQQMMQYAEEVNTALSNAQQLRTQIQQYQNMVTQGVVLPSSMFGSVAADLRSVANIYTKSQALGRNISDMDTQFNAQFPGFQSYLNSAAASAPASNTMPDRYKTWSQAAGR